MGGRGGHGEGGVQGQPRVGDERRQGPGPPSRLPLRAGWQQQQVRRLQKALAVRGSKGCALLCAARTCR